MKKYRIAAIAVTVLVVLIGMYFLWRGQASNNAIAAWQTSRLERGTLTATIGATGSVRARQSAVLTWQTSGTVESVYAHVGDYVTAGQVLATLAKTSLPQNIILAEADLVAAQRNLDTLLHSKTPAAQAQLNLAAAQQAVKDAERNYYNVTGKRASSETIENAEAQYALAMKRVDEAQKIYDQYASLPDDNPLKAQAYSNLYAAWQARDRALATLNWYLGKPSEIDIAKAEAQLALAKAQLEDAQREWERLKNGPDASDIRAAQARVAALEAALNAARITAPFAGVVTVARPLVGDQVSPGMIAFRLDDRSHLLVDVQVLEVDINSVQVGQPVLLTFDAVLNQEYHGKVIEVAQAGESVQGSVYFTVTVEMEDADSQVKPGMTAAVTIITKTLEDVLLVPNRAVRLVEGKRVVYVLRNGKLTPVEITLGATSDTVSEVAAGDLAAGDLIVLNPPAQLNDQGGGFRGGFRMEVR